MRVSHPPTDCPLHLLPITRAPLQKSRSYPRCKGRAIRSDESRRSKVSRLDHLRVTLYHVTLGAAERLEGQQAREHQRSVRHQPTERILRQPQWQKERRQHQSQDRRLQKPRMQLQWQKEHRQHQWQDRRLQKPRMQHHKKSSAPSDPPRSQPRSQPRNQGTSRLTR